MPGTPRLPPLRGGYLSLEKDPQREAAKRAAREKKKRMLGVSGRARGRWGLIRKNLKAEVARLKEELRKEMEADRLKTMEMHRMRQLLLRLSGKEDFTAWRMMAHDIHPLCENFFTVDEMCVHLAIHEGDLDKATIAILEDNPPYRVVREAIEDRIMHKDGVVFAGQRLEAMTLDEAVGAMTNPEDENKSITHLNLRFVDVGDDGAATIGAALSKTVQQLGVAHRRIQQRLNGNNQKKLPFLQNTRDSTKSKTELDCVATPAEKYDINDANTYCSVTHLKLSHNGITDFGAGMIASALKTPQCQICSLELKKNPLGTEGAKYIARALEDKNNKLTELTLGLTGMGREGVARLCAALASNNCKLEYLNLFCTKIGDAEAGSIAQVLASGNCTSLTELILPGTNIGSKGVSYLAQALAMPHACRLVSLNLEFNGRVGPEGAAYIAKALKSGSSEKKENAKRQNMDGGNVTSHCLLEGEIAKPQMLCSLTFLSLRGNNIGDLGAQCIASALESRRCRLLELNLEYNHIGEIGMMAIAKALQSDHCSLMMLYSFGNKMGPKAERLITKELFLRKNDALAKQRRKRGEGGSDVPGGEAFEKKEFLDTTLLEDHEDKVSTTATSTTSVNDIINRTIANDPIEAALKQNEREEAEAADEKAFEEWMRGAR